MQPAQLLHCFPRAHDFGQARQHCGDALLADGHGKDVRSFQPEDADTNCAFRSVPKGLIVMVSRLIAKSGGYLSLDKVKGRSHSIRKLNHEMRR